MKSIPIILKLNGLKDDKLELEANCSMIQYMKKYYIVTVHQGLPIKMISIVLNDMTYDFTHFVICGWNDIVLIQLEKEDFINICKLSKLFVFKQFVKKQIDHNTKYNTDICDKPHIIKYCKNELFPINMIPMNPMNLYYTMKFNKSFATDGNAGKPVYINNKLIGIIGKIDDYLYVIPIIYVLRSIEKQNNTHIYTIDYITDITKINTNRVNHSNGTIYYNKMHTWIPIDCYITLEGDNEVKYNTEVNSKSKNSVSTVKPFINQIISNNMELCITDHNILINSCFIHLIKICYKDIQLIETIFGNMEDKRDFNYDINDNNYTLSF